MEIEKIYNDWVIENKKQFDSSMNPFEMFKAGYNQALQLQQTGVSTCFLEDYEDHFFEVKYKQVSCCKIAPITDENYCPKCGKKILK